MIRKSPVSRSRKNSAGNKRKKRKSYAINSSSSYCGLCDNKFSSSEQHMSASHNIIRGANTSPKEFEYFVRATHLNNRNRMSRSPISDVYTDPTPTGGMEAEIDPSTLDIQDTLEELFVPEEGETVKETTYRAITLVVDTLGGDLSEANPQIVIDDSKVDNSIYVTHIQPVLIKYNIITDPNGTITIDRASEV